LTYPEELTRPSAKRFERLLKTYGLNRAFQPKDGTEFADGLCPSTPGSKTATPKKKRAPKRKHSKLDDVDEAEDVLDEA
jgi:hypothetical protein